MTTTAPADPTRRAAPPRTAHLARVDRYDLWVGSARVGVDSYTHARAAVETDLPVVFLHGWGMSHAGYRAGLEAMALKGVRVDAFALPGYGQSTPLPSRACSLADHAARMADAVEHAGFASRVHLTGHSFGAGIALKIAAARPDLVERLTLTCPVGGAADGPAPWPGLIRSFLLDGGGAGLRSFLGSLAPALRTNALTVAATGFAARRADLGSDLRQALEHGIDVHLIVADADAIAPAGALSRPGAGARISVVAGQHNWPHVAPEKWAELTIG